MAKRNIYLAQINYLHGKSTFLPYAVGTLIAAAKANEEINEFYDFMEPVFIRKKTDEVLEEIEQPYLVGFSNYVWNHEYNKVLARKIKDKYPDCLILFGGHHISTDTALMSEDYIDFMIFGEGEEIFEALLLALKNGADLETVPNLAYRKDGDVYRTQTKKAERCDYPSPYLTGVFDSILKKYPEIDFHTIIETNRGCPYSCTYCDWGNLKCPVRLFPEERVMQELKWLSDHGISGFGCADANFGLFERDEKFVDEMVRLHNEEGVLSRFQVSSAKNSNDRVFRISQKLNECGMDKGATLSFQSLNPVVLENIKRKNIPVETFTSLLNKYNEAGIPTYSELILGLPGETYESLVEGIDILLEAGQHNSLYIHDCEWLPCATMGDESYMKEHGVKFVVIPLNEPHTLVDSEDEIQEKSRVVVETNTMSREDWVKMNLYSVIIQSFHHEGLLMMFSLYLYNEKGIKFSTFYKSFIDRLIAEPDTVGGRVYAKLRERFEAVARGEDSVVWVDRRFGNVGWTPEEYAFLNVAIEVDKFYSEVESFLKGYFDDEELFNDLFAYQKSVVKLPFRDDIVLETEYDFKNYFYNILCINDAKPERRKCINTIPTVKCNSWEDYARYVVWYGRKESRNIYLDEIEVTHKN